MMSFNNTTTMKVQKQNEKRTKRSARKQKLLQSPLNDLEAYKNVDIEEIRVAVPADGSVPTWREANGSVKAMVKSRAEDGSFEYRPRRKAGPSAGKKYRPRANKMLEVLRIADKNEGQINNDGMQVLDDCISSLPGSKKAFNAGEEGKKCCVSSSMKATAALDYQALIHAWQMRSMGVIADKEFLMIKQNVFGAAMAPVVEEKKVEESVAEVVSAEQMTF